MGRGGGAKAPSPNLNIGGGPCPRNECSSIINGGGGYVKQCAFAKLWEMDKACFIEESEAGHCWSYIKVVVVNNNAACS